MRRVVEEPSPSWDRGRSSTPDTVLTVAHVVAGAEAITVTDRNGVALEASIAAIDTERDLAVLDVPGLDATRVPRAAFEPGDEGTAYGLGTRGDLDWSIARAVTIRFSDIYDEGVHERAGYELEAAIERGDSGAGLFADDGSLGGVVFASSLRADDRAWATAIEVADPLIAAAREPGARPPAAVACVAPCPPQRLTVPPADDCLP